MNNEIKEEMYIRTQYNDFCNQVSIRKIIEIDEDDNKFWIDKYIVDTFGDEQNKLETEDVEIFSFCIADVLKVGDFVNGRQVIEIVHFKDEKFFRIKLFGGKNIYNINDIKSIMTYEEFSIIRYEV